ncbi:MAG: zinc-ribbon domain-containing protein [Candidatus Heimdallarchaeota archaeon]|nr:zinc-ribbon domain-containing protein [Candidatus Heimdallarchaeota archaeon]MCG3255788.1 zinc-ribbon domain-containing protein [Candidatus Heimdallarchaeota archaeon]MCK4610861.1 zinc-ribbon domain-containing protein [Candidatus Heimdallarchaeota archaeon]
MKKVIKKVKNEEEKVNVCLKCGRPIAKREKFCMSCGIILNIRQHYPHNLL